MWLDVEISSPEVLKKHQRVVCGGVLYVWGAARAGGMPIANICKPDDGL
jgi:hypothetical protein